MFSCFEIGDIVTLNNGMHGFYEVTGVIHDQERLFVELCNGNNEEHEVSFDAIAKQFNMVDGNVINALELINILFPEHSRTDCDDGNMCNAQMHNDCVYCSRCFALKMMEDGSIELPKGKELRLHVLNIG